MVPDLGLMFCCLFGWWERMTKKEGKKKKSPFTYFDILIPFLEKPQSFLFSSFLTIQRVILKQSTTQKVVFHYAFFFEASYFLVNLVIKERVWLILWCICFNLVGIQRSHQWSREKREKMGKGVRISMNIATVWAKMLAKIRIRHLKRWGFPKLTRTG